MKKYKATGCARFFVVMLILAPLAYVGASLYNGEDPIENIKGLLGRSDSSDDNTYSPPASNEESAEQPVKNDSGDSGSELQQLQDAYKKLEEENKYLKIQVQTLEGQLEAVKDTTG